MKNIRPFLIDPGVTMRVAMQKLDESGQKILFVVSSDDVLIGSLTDGDVRRWILSSGGLDATVDDVCNRRPFSVREHFDLEQVRDECLKRGFDAVPVLSPQSKVVDVMFREDLFGSALRKVPKAKLEIPVVIMAGGRGTRLAPFTHILPKPLIPIGDKSILELIIDKFQAFGVNHIFLTVHHKAKIIKSYFEELQPPYVIEYLHEEHPLGTAGSLTLLKGKVKDRLLVTNCDIIMDLDFADLDAFHTNSKYDITLVASMKSYSIPYGVCEIENGGMLLSIDEKPEHTFLVSTGMYIVNVSMLNLIPDGKLFHMTDLIAAARAAGARIGVYPISESAWRDTGEWEEYRKALQVLKV